MRLLPSAIVVVAASAGLVSGQGTPPPATRPNIVLIVTDDMGYGDLSSYGAPDIRTPSIDGLARQGVRLTDFYANGVMCSPTRAALMTGRYQQRLAFEYVVTEGSPMGLRASGRTLPRWLRDAGYATGLVGKWHLGTAPDMVPMAHGFDFFYGFLGSHEDYYHHNRGPSQPDLWEGDRRITEDGYLTDLFTERSVRFIEQHSAAGRPFFLEVAYNAPHWPFQRPDRPSPPPGTGALQLPDGSGTATRADYVSMVESLDRGVGRILAAVDRARIADDTLVIFTNDNGGEWLSRNAPLFNRKWTVWEGGIRVPAIFRWPGHLPRGRVSPQVGVTMDLTATILAAAGISPGADARLEGIDLLPLLAGRTPAVSRTLYWRTNVGSRTMRAIRSGDWKLVVDSNHQFVFNLRDDMAERHDLTSARPDVAGRLRPQLARWEQDVDGEAERTVPDFVRLVRALPGYVGGTQGGGRRAVPVP